MTIEANTNQIGYGSWRATQSYNDYRDRMTLTEYQRYILDQCIERIERLGIERGDMITLVEVGGRKPRKYTGIVTAIYGGGSELRLQQRRRERWFDVRYVDDIEIIEKVVDVMEDVGE